MIFRPFFELIGALIEAAWHRLRGERGPSREQVEKWNRQTQEHLARRKNRWKKAGFSGMRD